MTIPNLMTKYHRSVVEKKLVKFYSVVNQALRMSIADHGGIVFIDQDDITDENGRELIYDWYQENIFQYMSGITTSKIAGTAYVKAIFADGTGFVSYIQNKKKLWMKFCMDASDKSCERFEHYDGRKTFLYRYDQELNNLVGYGDTSPLSEVKNNCYKYYDSDIRKHFCLELIRRNGWKIPEDYPWIK